MRNTSLEEQIAGLYNPEMPYHNFDHARMVLQEGLHIIDKCSLEGIAVAKDVVYFACLLHDAGYHENEKKLGFDSKEAYSAHLAEELLLSHAVSPDTVAAVKNAILCTHVDGQCSSNEDKIVKAADLSGLSADYKVFKKNAIKLQEEYELLSGRTVSWEEWRKGVVERIELFLRDDFSLTSDFFDTTGKSVFHEKVRMNLDRIIVDDRD